MTLGERVRAYAAHWDGAACPKCGGDCVWVGERDRLVCRCRVRSALGVWLGDTPTERDA